MRLAWVFLATVALIAGCGGDPISTSRSEPAILTADPAPGVNYVGVIGDSYTSGSPEGGHGPHSWIELVKTQLKTEGVDIALNSGAVGASGYVSPGHFQAGVFADQVGRVVGSNDRLVVIFGSRNDAKVPAEQLAPAVHTALTKVREKAPNAKILLISPAWSAWNTYEPSVDMLKVRDVLESESAAFGATLLDPITDRWFADRPDLIGADNVHPTDEGHVYMAGKIAPVIAQLLKPSPPAP